MDPVILLVEDNPDEVELTLLSLRKHNISHRVVVAPDGSEALDYLFSAGKYSGGNSEAPAVIFLDLKLPKVNGLEVLRRLRAEERTRLLPVVILTSSQEEQDMINSYRLGANGYVLKPADFVQFSEAVRQLALYWLSLNEPPPGRG